MSELTCSCPHCGQDLNVGSEFAGQAMSCPSCSGEFAVPEAPHLVPVLPSAHAEPKLNLPGSAPAQAPPMQAPPQSPYQAPASNVGGPHGQAYGAPPMVSPNAIHLFAQTKPWVTFFAVLGSIWPAVLLLIGLIVAFAGTSGGAPIEGTGAGLMLALLGSIYFLPAWRLWQYSSAIGQLRIAPSPSSLDAAIDKQRCFWKTVGLITLIGFAISVIMFLIGLSAARTV
jgi:hypothetical protein